MVRSGGALKPGRGGSRSGRFGPPGATRCPLAASRRCRDALLPLAGFVPYSQQISAMEKLIYSIFAILCLKWETVISISLSFEALEFCEIWRARSRPYRSRFLEVNTYFAASFVIYNICALLHWLFEICKLLIFIRDFCKIPRPCRILHYLQKW